MLSIPAVIDVPLRADVEGVIRLGDTRITLETIIAAYRRGDTPEDIVDGFPTLKLADIHALIAYYLNHRDDVDAYLQQQNQDSQTIRQEIETQRPDMLRRQARFRALL